MRTVKKQTLDELLRIVRKYARTGDVDILSKHSMLSQMLSNEAFGNEHKWLSFANIADAIVGIRPLINGASNQTVYDVLKILGIEIAEEIESDN